MTMRRPSAARESRPRAAGKRRACGGAIGPWAARRRGLIAIYDYESSHSTRPTAHGGSSTPASRRTGSSAAASHTRSNGRADRAARAALQAQIRRWINTGLLAAEQTTPGAPWRMRLTDEIRARFVPEVPDGYLPLADAARRLGCARQTVLHRVQRGELHAIHVTNGQRKGLRIKVPAAPLDQLLNG